MAKQTFGQVLETAQHEPVLIKKHNHPAAVMLSVAEYDRLKLIGSERSQPMPSHPIVQASVSKSLPVIPAKPGSLPSHRSVRKMIDLVHEAELDA